MHSYYITLNFTLQRPEPNVYQVIHKFLTERGYRRMNTNTSYRTNGAFDIDDSREYFCPNDEYASETDVFKSHVEFERTALNNFMTLNNISYRVDLQAVPDIN